MFILHTSYFYSTVALNAKSKMRLVGLRDKISPDAEYEENFGRDGGIRDQFFWTNNDVKDVRRSHLRTLATLDYLISFHC